MSALTYLALTPLGVFNALRLRSLYLVPGAAGVLAAYSYYPNPTSPGSYQNLADWAVVSLTTAALAAAMALLFATSLWWDHSISLDVAPWRAGQEEALARAVKKGLAVVEGSGEECCEKEESPLSCPFYPWESTVTQCCACGTVVSQRGMHEARGEGGARGVAFDCAELTALAGSQERVFSYGSIVLDPCAAMRAVEREDNIAEARKELDLALDFKGNACTAQVGRCCIGCYIYQRCHNVVPRLAQVCAFAAFPLACAPWAASGIFDRLGPGVNGFVGILAALWAGASFFLVLDAVATPMAFMRKFSHLPFPYPNGVFTDRVRDVLCGLFAASLP